VRSTPSEFYVVDIPLHPWEFSCRIPNKLLICYQVHGAQGRSRNHNCKVDGKGFEPFLNGGDFWVLGGQGNGNSQTLITHRKVGIDSISEKGGQG